MAYRRNVVVIGGGTGTSAVLRGLREYNVELAAIITTADNGGSSGVLRKELGIVPPGDARQCLLALSDNEDVLARLFNHRFGGRQLKGHNLGNLFLAALAEKNGGKFQPALEEAERMFSAQGSIIPATEQPTTLVAELRNGRRIKGEIKIAYARNIKKDLRRLVLLPKNIEANPKALRALKRADAIIIGPGLFSSIFPPLLVRGISEGIKRSAARKIYLANLLPNKDKSDSYYIADYLFYLDKYLGAQSLDYVIYNTVKLSGDNYPSADQRRDKRFVGAPLARISPGTKQPNDPLQRSVITHHPQKTAEILIKLIYGR